MGTKMASQLAEHLDLTYSQTWALLDRYDYNASKKYYEIRAGFRRAAESPRGG